MTPPNRRIFFAALAAACICATMGAAPASAQFVPIAVGTFSTVVNSINDHGDMVGSQLGYLSSGVESFEVSADGSVTPIGIRLLQLGATSVAASGINSAGKIVGQYDTHGFLRVKENYKTIDFPGADFTVPLAINDSDFIVGYYLQGGTFHGFRSSGGTTGALDVPGATSTQATGINNSGQIVGIYSGGDCTSQCGFRYKNGRFSKFMVPGSIQTIVNGISNSGIIVGSYTGQDFPHGFQELNGVFTNVDVPHSDSGSTVVMGANSSGELVGSFLKSIDNLEENLVLEGFVKKP